MSSLSSIIVLSAFEAIMPKGRRAAIMATFEQVAGLRNATEADPTALLEAFYRLSLPQEGDTPYVAARRATLTEIVKGANHVPNPEIDVQKAAWWFASQLNEWEWINWNHWASLSKARNDPHQKEMWEIAWREAQELGLRFCQGCLTESFTPEYTQVTCTSGCGMSYAKFVTLGSFPWLTSPWLDSSR